MCEQAAAQLAHELGHEKLKVAIYTIPMMGHALPMISIGRSLAQRGHEVIFAVSEGLGSKLKDLCKTAGMRYFGMSDGATDAIFVRLKNRLCEGELDMASADL
eukprot:s748_g12.t1